MIAQIARRDPILITLFMLALALGCRQQTDRLPSEQRGTSFEFQAVGPDFNFRPTITNVQVVDLDGNGRQDVLACDVQQNGIFSYHWEGDDWVERQLATDLIAPAHATVVDIDADDDNDIVVSVMGNLHPDDGVIGSIVLLENIDGNYKKRTILDDVRRVVDAQPSDLDGDGDLDLAVAVFGYLRGQVLWLENLGDGTFRDHQLLEAPGTIHVPIADYDNDGDPDIAAIVSQEEEEVWIFENQGNGQFANHRVFFTINFDIGSAGLVQTDLDQDGDVDLLLPVGDNLEDKYSHPQPYHGCLWLENQGELKFTARRIAQFPGTYAAAVGDVDHDTDNDVVLVSMINDWDAPESASVVWLENDGSQSFTQRVIARHPIQLTTVDVGDINHDGRVDIVAGGLHVFRPYDRLGRISCWLNRESVDTMDSPVNSATTQEVVAEPIPDVPVPNFSILDSITANALRAMTEHVANLVEQATVTREDWNQLGAALFAYGFFAEAHDCLQKSVDLDAGHHDSQFLLASCQSRRGHLSEAITHFTKARDCADNDADRRRCELAIGKSYLRLEDMAQAEVSLRRAGNHPHALYELAKLLMRSDRSTEARQVLDRLRDQHPFAIEYLLLRARVHESLGELDEAFRLRDFAEYNSRRLPTDPFVLGVERIRNRLGLRQKVLEAQGLLKSDQVESALRILNDVQAAGWDQPALMLTAMAELKRSNPGRAIEILEQLLADRGHFPQAMLLLGDAYLMAEDTGKARAVWEATATFRSGIALHERLGSLYDRANETQNSQQQNALRLQALGIADLRNSETSRAANAFRQATHLVDELPLSWFYLGECHRLSGRPELAADAYRRCLKLAPHHGRARTQLDRLEKP